MPIAARVSQPIAALMELLLPIAGHGVTMQPLLWKPLQPTLRVVCAKRRGDVESAMQEHFTLFNFFTAYAAACPLTSIHFVCATTYKKHLKRVRTPLQQPSLTMEQHEHSVSPYIAALLFRLMLVSTM